MDDARRPEPAKMESVMSFVPQDVCGFTPNVIRPARCAGGGCRAFAHRGRTMTALGMTA
jgi:hypothetical protein